MLDRRALGYAVAKRARALGVHAFGHADDAPYTLEPRHGGGLAVIKWSSCGDVREGEGRPVDIVTAALWLLAHDYGDRLRAAIFDALPPTAETAIDHQARARVAAIATGLRSQSGPTP